MCGDSTLKEDINTLIEGKTVEMVFTDPPWNVNYGATDHPSWKSRQIKNDCMSSEDFKEFMEKSFARMSEALVVGGMVYVVMSAQEWGSLMPALADNDFHWSSTIIWNKDRLVLSRKDYHTRYEPIWYGWKDGAPRIHPLTDRQQCDVWDIPRPSKSEEHPTMKPVELVQRAIENSSKRGNFVLDQFGGSEQMKLSKEKETLTNKAMKLASEKGLPLDLVSFFIGADEDSTNANLKALEATYNASVQKGLEARLKTDGYTPPAGGEGGKSLEDLSMDEYIKQRQKG